MLFPIAHELRAWLLHYSPAVLHGLLREVYYDHHVLFIEGIYLLLKDNISQTDIEQSMKLLKHYCFLFSSLYGRFRYHHFIMLHDHVIFMNEMVTWLTKPYTGHAN